MWKTRVRTVLVSMVMMTAATVAVGAPAASAACSSTTSTTQVPRAGTSCPAPRPYYVCDKKGWKKVGRFWRYTCVRGHWRS